MSESESMIENKLIEQLVYGDSQWTYRKEDIPALDKAIFLIDRKDLDAQTTMAFRAYANHGLIDVDETENVNDLKKKLKSSDRQVIVTTIQKLHRLILI